MKTPHRTFSLLLATALLLPAACGGGGGGGGGPAAADLAEVQIAYPTARLTTTADTVRVRGTASAVDGISALEVGGASASSKTDFADWTAQVPLDPGMNELPVQVTDGAGRVSVQAQRNVERRVSLLNGGNSFAPSSDGTRLYFVDSTLDALVEVEIATGTQRLVAQGTFFQTPRRICLDPSGQFAYLTDTTRDGVVEVQLSSGITRTVTSTSMNTSFPLLGGPDDLVYDLNHGPARLILADYTRDGIVAVNIATGIRSYVSKSGERGSGPVMTSPRGVCWSGPDTILVCDLGTDAILEVNVVSGNRTVVASSSVGTGTTIPGPYSITPTSNPDEFLYVDLADNKLVQLNLNTRVRSLIAERTQQPGSWISTNEVAIDPLSGFPLVLDTSLDTVFRVDPSNGTYSEYLSQRVGAGRNLRNVTGPDLDRSTGRVIGADFSRSEIVATDVATGERTVLWTNGTGGQTLDNPADVAVLEPGVRYAVADEREVHIFEVATGEMSLLSGEDGSFGQKLTSNYRCLHYVASESLLLGTDGKTLFSIDLETGRRTVRSSTSAFSDARGISADETGGWVYVLDRIDRDVVRARITSNQFWSYSRITDGTSGNNPLSSPTDIQVLPDGETLVVVDRSNERLVYVDIASGNRWLLSGPEDDNTMVGLGAGFVGVESVLLLPEGGIAVLDEGLDALLLVDQQTGDRAVIAH